MKKKALKLYSSAEDSFLIEDYPWGFRLRTEVRVWAECKKGFGMRVCRQTKNPKTGRWCAVKKSTYSPVIGFYLNEEDRIKTTGLSAGGWSKEEAIVAFEKFYEEIGLTEFQKNQIKYVRATNIMNDVISYEIKAGEPIDLSKVMDGDPEETAKMKALEEGRQTEEEKQEILNKAFSYGMGVVEGKIERIKKEEGSQS